jgi:hypothetical protein
MDGKPVCTSGSGSGAESVGRVQVLGALYGGQRPDASAQRQAHAWLLDVQGSAAAWQLARELLSSPVRPRARRRVCRGPMVAKARRVRRPRLGARCAVLWCTDTACRGHSPLVRTCPWPAVSQTHRLKRDWAQGTTRAGRARGRAAGSAGTAERVRHTRPPRCPHSPVCRGMPCCAPLTHAQRQRDGDTQVQV